MADKALFVDLPNFYSCLLRSDIDEPRLLRDYFLEWLDFDRLAEKLTGEPSSVWIFYSGKRLGPSSYRIKEECLEDYIDRINSLKGVTARNVNIEGKQRESAEYTCRNCGATGIAEWESEKGIDASLTVHLFDTMDSWQAAYLLSGDADFVPAVVSLRRRGKIVIGAGFGSRSSALVRECYEYVNLGDLFLKDDIFAYRLFGQDGLIQKWLYENVEGEGDNMPLQLGVEWQGPILYLMVTGPVDLKDRLEFLQELKCKYPNGVDKESSERQYYRLIVSNSAWPSVERRLEAFVSSLKNTHPYVARNSGQGFQVNYEYNQDTKKYEVKRV